MTTTKGPKAQRLLVVCQNCGKLLGTILNFGKADAVQVSLPCPCGGSSAPIQMAPLYKAVPDGIVSEQLFGLSIEQAIETARTKARANSAG
jgi:hypothetical protein